MALTRIPRLSLTQAHILYKQAGSAAVIMEHRKELRDVLPDMADGLADAIAHADEAIDRAQREYDYAQQKHIRCLTPADSTYPRLLSECEDAPLVLYSLGAADLNNPHAISVVGTRRITEYGKDLCRRFIDELHQAYPDMLIVSGLAYGVDICAHREALAHKMPTVGVLAHGLDTIYPSVHRNTAIQMLEQGGLLTEYMSQTAIDKGNFVRRNRIVAGMTTATVVVESAAKGGALITAGLAADYNREVCAFPGRIFDAYSAGCNRIIAQQQARLIQSADDFLEVVGWAIASDKQRTASGKTKGDALQQELFPNLSNEEQAIVNTLRGSDGKAMNQIVIDTNTPINQVSATLFELEMKGLVYALGGARYRLAR